MRISTLLCALAVTACSGNQPSSSPAATAPPPAEPAPAAEPPTPEPPAIADEDVVGSWRTTGTDFEELTIEAGGSWSSFLHGRPAYSGTWTLEGRSLTLASGAVDEPMVLSEIAVAGDRIEGVFQSQKVTWTKIPE